MPLLGLDCDGSSVLCKLKVSSLSTRYEAFASQARDHLRHSRLGDTEPINEVNGSYGAARRAVDQVSDKLEVILPDGRAAGVSRMLERLGLPLGRWK
jgi:hypothetical protein